MRLDDNFANGLKPAWTQTEAGEGRVIAEDGILRLVNYVTPPRRYTNAQITDYSYDDFALRWRPPVRMTIHARAVIPAGGLRGTAGFGFWNHPLSPGSSRLPRLPRVVWFFFSAVPSNLQLAYGVPGPGWKAAIIDAANPGALALAPLALPVALLTRFPTLYRRLWPPLQRRLRIAEQLLDVDLLQEMHTYQIDWRRDRVIFSVDGTVVLETPDAPQGSGGFIAWIDNQYAVITPQAHLGWGVVPLDGEQALEIDQIEVMSEE